MHLSQAVVSLINRDSRDCLGRSLDFVVVPSPRILKLFYAAQQKGKERNAYLFPNHLVLELCIHLLSSFIGKI